ncbi:unnamed protein product, partial [Polarella glacialis]
CGRYPTHLWDGPFHRLVDKHVPPQVLYARSVVKRRGANVDNRTRKAFLDSCCPGRHPIDRSTERGEAEEHGQECLILKEMLAGPESAWLEEARNEKSLLGDFMREAKQVGAKQWYKGQIQETGQIDAKTGTRNYSETAWLSQQILCQQCPSPKIAVELLLALVQFSKVAKKIPSVDAIPVLNKWGVLCIAAATSIQSCWRAHAARTALGCGLYSAIIIRRAALCIQRAWRWSLLKRRMHILSLALQVMRSVRTSSFYV